MKLKFKILRANERNEWLGWFGSNLIKVRLLESANPTDSLIKFIAADLGIEQSKIVILETKENFVDIELPDIAWELFLSAM